MYCSTLFNTILCNKVQCSAVKKTRRCWHDVPQTSEHQRQCGGCAPLFVTVGNIFCSLGSQGGKKAAKSRTLSVTGPYPLPTPPYLFICTMAPTLAMVMWPPCCKVDKAVYTTAPSTPGLLMTCVPLIEQTRTNMSQPRRRPATAVGDERVHILQMWWSRKNI